MQDRCELLLLLWILLLQTAAGQLRPINGDNDGRCETLTSTVCADVGYNNVYLPNARGHDTQVEADGEISDFTQLISSGCSDALYFLLCSYYFPLCFTDPVNNQPQKVRTCRSLCEFVRPACEPNLNEVNLPWPVFLNCSLDEFSDEATCFGPADLTNLTVLGTVPNIEVTVTQVGNQLPTTSATGTPSATAIPITPTPPPQSTTRGGRVITTTNASSATVTKVASVKMAALTAVIILFICNYLQL